MGKNINLVLSQVIYLNSMVEWSADITFSLSGLKVGTFAEYDVCWCVCSCYVISLT